MKIIAKNRKASFEYYILDKFEAGIVLVGSELKSLRQGKVNIADSFCDIHSNELFLLNSHIAEYRGANRFNHEPTRKRKLLLHRKEINKIIGKIQTKGMSVVPLLIYFNNKNKVKLEIAIVQGKKLYDKRKSIKDKEWNRKKQRILKQN